jgi:hypothetical protein
VQVWNKEEGQFSGDSNHSLRDEFALALFECGLVIIGENSKRENPKFALNWIHVAFEIADVCFKVLDWKDNQTMNKNHVSLSYLMFLS